MPSIPVSTKDNGIFSAASVVSQNFKLNRPNIHTPPMSILRQKLILMTPHNDRQVSNLSTPAPCTRKFASRDQELVLNVAWRSNR
jgi:hypothetical protein